jgi:hypothetical protein
MSLRMRLRVCYVLTKCWLKDRLTFGRERYSAPVIRVRNRSKVNIRPSRVVYRKD